MTATGLWQDIGRGDTLSTKLLRLLFFAAALLVFVFFCVLPLTWPQQVVCGLLFLFLAIGLSRSSDSYIVTLTLMIMSLFCTFRYGYWRISTLVQFFRDPTNRWGVLDVFFMALLLGAELYYFVVMALGYFQTIWPLRRAPVAMPDDEAKWPHVDVLIPTYNEPLEVVRYTVLGALNIDWPAEKLHVYLLDDGRRKEFEAFAREAGVGYRIRPDNKHAKAGNINTALKSLDSPYVAIFDCDHVPTRSFLQMSLGWFLRDRKLAMLQTPHHFYSPDPFERNLGQFRVIPNEGELFYGVIQDGNDFWNATFFCGSCAVLRRTALDEIGGIAVETVTEDAHTSLRMQMRGWSTAYINIPQAAGLATESLSAHIGQRIRWARGMIQILRTDNPLTAPGLKLPQRLCYFNAMLHFLYALPRLIFMASPLVYLLLNKSNMPGYWVAIMAYAVPHLVLANLTSSRIQGEHRHSFWNEIYETVLAPYILLPTLFALFNPKAGKFNVTAKGGIVDHTYFDRKIAQPFLFLLGLSGIGLAVAALRFFIFDPAHQGTVLMNSLWCVYNIVILGVCIAVAHEMRQMRSAVRVNMEIPVILRLPGGRTLSAETIDMSATGLSIRLNEEVSLAPLATLGVVFPIPSSANDLTASVIGVEGNVLRARFEAHTLAEQELLTTILFTRADSWLGWGESRETDNVARSMVRILVISLHGLAATVKDIFAPEDDAAKNAKRLSAIAPVVLFALLLGGARPLSAQGQSQAQADSAQAGPAMPGSGIAVSGLVSANSSALDMPDLGTAERRQIQQEPIAQGQFRDVFSLSDTGSKPIDLHGIGNAATVYFTLPETQVPRSAKLHIFYLFSPSLMAQVSYIRVSVNGTVIASIEPTAQGSGTASVTTEQVLDIPADLLVHNNSLRFEFVGHYALTCEDPANATVWAHIHSASFLEIDGDLLPLEDDLKQLPLPFLDQNTVGALVLPIVFGLPPSRQAVQAAGIAASYFGMVAESRPVRFPVSIGVLPRGNVVVIADSAENLPPGLNLPAIHGPTVAMRVNPSDPFGKVLVIAGTNGAQAIEAAQAVALHSGLLDGPTVTIDSLRLPASQKADEAPRWAQSNHTIALWNYTSSSSMETDGSKVLNTYFSLPPDIFYSERPNAILHLSYRYNSIPLGPVSSLQMRINGAYMGSVPLEPGEQSARTTAVDVAVPVVNLRPFSNSLSFEFTFQAQQSQKPCSGSTPPSMMGAILRDSYIDLRGYPHYAPMPNLEIFANAGYPFTRFADLGNTVVVLPAQPTAQEIEMFVTLMGHFSRQTGYPALRVTVAGPESLDKGATTDFLVIGAGEDQPGFDKLAGYLPVSLVDGKIQVHDTAGFLAPLHDAWWKVKSGDSDGSGALVAGGDAPDAVMEGIESPFDPGGRRSIVAIRLKDDATYEPFLSTFLYVQQASDIQGSVSFLLGTRFQSFRVGSSVYYIGELPLWTRLEIWFARSPWLAGLIVMVFAFLMAIWVRQWLRLKARSRLKMPE